MRHYLRDHSRLIRLPAWVQERGEFPEAPQSLDGLGETEGEAGDSEQWLVDRRQDTERAALARVEASRVLRRARLSPRQLAAIRQREFTTVPLNHGQSHSATVAARKLRQAGTGADLSDLPNQHTGTSAGTSGWSGRSHYALARDGGIT